MSLVLDYRWEHALTAATIDAAKRACPNCYLGRTAVQKLLYFLKVLGVPMRYDFELYHYGPFCATVLQDVEWLQADDVVLDVADRDRYSNYKTGPAWPQLKELFRDELEEYMATIRSVVDALGELEPDTLELIATLDFCYRWVRAKKGHGRLKEATIQKFKDVKKSKFAESEIDRWYDTLAQAGLIEE